MRAASALFVPALAAALALAAGPPAIAAPSAPARPAASLGSVSAAAPRGTTVGAGPVVSSWTTTPDRAQLLAEQPPLRFSGTASSAPTIVVDPSRTYQSVTGFGASITDSSASVISALPASQRDALMGSIFSSDGIGMSFLRQPIGSSDFTAASEHYTFDDVPAGQTDFDLAHFSIDHDRGQIIPLLTQAKGLDPELSVMLTPWSPPAWMKTGDSLVGGTLKPGAQYVDAYARYLAASVRAYEAAGVHVDYLSVQNEPQNRTPAGYPGTDLPAATEAAVIQAVGPMLAGTGTRILGYDHNWRTDPNDVAHTPAGESPDVDYPYELLESGASADLGGIAYHCYSGLPSAMTALHDAYPGVGIWETECSGSHGADDTFPTYFNDTLRFDARTLAVGSLRNWSKSVVTWNLALRPDGTPHLGGCSTCTGVVSVAADGTVTRNAEFYALGQLSEFVKPGAVRIASTSFGTPAYNGQIDDVAFRNPDGSLAVYVHNENDQPRQVALQEGDRRVETTLPGGSVTTFTWTPTAALAGGAHPVPLGVVTATATASAADAPPALAVDGDASTRWSSGTAQTPGLALTVNLHRFRVFREVDLDAGGSLGDYLRDGTVQTSLDGRTWRTVATVHGVGQLTQVPIRPTVARFVRITSTGSSGSWWSVADLRLLD